MAKSRLYTRKSPKMSINHEQIQKIVPDTCTREADRTRLKTLWKICTICTNVIEKPQNINE